MPLVFGARPAGGTPIPDRMGIDGYDSQKVSEANFTSILQRKPWFSLNDGTLGPTSLHMTRSARNKMFSERLPPSEPASDRQKKRSRAVAYRSIINGKKDS